MVAKLKRQLGLLECTLVGVGIIIGAGIYSLIGKATAIAGNDVWVSFALAALAAVFTGLSYAELSSMFTKSGGEFEYALNAFGKKTAFTAGWLMLFVGIVGSAAVSLGFAGYFASLTSLPLVPVAIALVALCSIINYIGIKQSTGIADTITLFETLGLIVVITLGVGFFSTLNIAIPTGNVSHVLSAASLVFFAFIGFEGIVKLSEETRQPAKTIPRALLLSVAITSVLYILTAFAGLAILGSEQLGTSTAPLADVAGKALGASSGQAFFVLAIIALFSTANTVLLLLVATSRLLYGMAEDKVLPKVLARIDRNRGTPFISIFLVGFLAIAFVLLGNIEFVARLTDFAVFVVFMLVNLAVIVMRFTHASLRRQFRTPFSVFRVPLLPVFGILVCFGLALSLGFEVIIGGIALTVIGVIASFTRVKPL